MFWLITGKPGCGKTSHAIDFLLHDERFAVEGSETRRPVYYRGIRDLAVEWHELTDSETEKWPEHLPDGAVLVVDEAQQIWPVRPSSKPVPAGLTALETHRHHGWDIIFISQDPSLLDTHARKICNEQFHYSRPFGAPFVIEYHSGSGYVNPASRTDLASCIQKKKKLPKRVWHLYKSAEIHTHKFRLPKLVYIAGVLVLLVVIFVYRFMSGVGLSDDTSVINGENAAMEQVGPSTGTGVGRYQAPASWSELMAPEVPGLPYTAPLYNDIARQPTTAPVIHGCMAFENDQSDCRCYTQQGTRIADMPHAMCLKALKDGVFNHLASNDSDATGRGAPRRDEGASGVPSGGARRAPSEKTSL
ncbi:Zonular occludens toxin [Alcanivorax balearicus MACL04]|uniref:Zonular occludens toxin n=1 Tax=Alloalcanivorax balearicus MACL04 TaxID=1177182 RepID=A0ABT2R500_9GAMM|nr:zonular occludens toxin domain-containing protein [Alloalcanivorax balearicus]MCU5784834.1 Zonular occludens toxin [Alloalcanivorax balearicus MACL04]